MNKRTRRIKNKVGSVLRRKQGERDTLRTELEQAKLMITSLKARIKGFKEGVDIAPIRI